MSEKIATTLTVNGCEQALELAPERTLLDVLREDLRLTGVKRGCDQGSCGACFVLADGEPVFSCLSLAVTMSGRAITTIEGLGEGPSEGPGAGTASQGGLHPVQRALVEHGAVQCGFCMPGVVIAAAALLDRNLQPTEADIRHALGSNVCRCSGYAKVVQAIASLGQDPEVRRKQHER